MMSSGKLGTIMVQCVEWLYCNRNDLRCMHRTRRSYIISLINLSGPSMTEHFYTIQHHIFQILAIKKARTLDVL